MRVPNRIPASCVEQIHPNVVEDIAISEEDFDQTDKEEDGD